MKRRVTILLTLLFVILRINILFVYSEEGNVDTKGRHWYCGVLYVRPPFYNGKMPLTFYVGKRLVYSNGMLTVLHHFDRFNTYFFYADEIIELAKIPVQAKTYDNDENLVAEATFTGVGRNNSMRIKGIEITEIHYDRNGKIIFKCKSFMRLKDEVKGKEYNAVGKKINEYYFIWPMGQLF